MCDHSESASSRLKWSLRGQLRCDACGHRCYFSGHSFPDRRLSPLEALGQSLYCIHGTRVSVEDYERVLLPVLR